MYYIICIDSCSTCSTITTKLVSTYEQQRQKFLRSASLSQFKKLFPASATNYRLSNGKVPIKLKLTSDWDKDTIGDLEKLVKILGILGSHLHLSEVGFGCIEVTWLCTISVAEDIQKKIETTEIRSSFQTMGVTKILLFEKEHVILSPQSKCHSEVSNIIKLSLHYRIKDDTRKIFKQ